MRILRYCYILLLLGLLATGCKKDDDRPPDTSGDGFGDGVFVLNEGNFDNGNASLGFYRPGADSIENYVFKKANKRPLGDVLQSMMRLGDHYYIVVNNSQKIEVADVETLKTTAVIEGFTSPRYMQHVGNGKLYVTDLYANGIWVVNAASNKIEKKIAFEGTGGSFGGWTEQLLYYNNKVYVNAVKARKVLVIDPVTDKILDSIPTGPDPQGLVLDRQGRLWVLCNGFVNGENSRLQCFSMANYEMLQDLVFPDKKADPKRLKMNTAGDELYYLDRHLYRFGISDNALSSQPLATSSASDGFYGLGVAADGSFFLGESKGFLQNGSVYRYSAQGELLGTYQAGVGPGEFYFVP